MKTLVQMASTCQACGKNKGHRREVYSKHYQGPCGDSFCYASCDMDTCRPVSMVICDDCFKKHSKASK